MAREGKGKVIQISKGARTRYVSIPADVAGDDRFPFETGEEVTVSIDEDGSRIVISKK
ncbi:AbrB/MazE/SpoVT family DNA-binding domain-containing protein [Methanogenium sp. MK-MG]|uniref:AbrB/MazE/SpoVT family DNA-binding domain-containing protein n=1 Tax=Methanogenium sp. MK-MG TaxID=2599926 RepID=UPI0013EC6258|nr:hypothetical protein [Methanogenium sp. MK-MG]